MKDCFHCESTLALVGLLLGLVATASIRAAVVQVPADYPSIQAAVDAARNADTIQIAAGVYAGQVLISNKSLTLSGSPGAVLRASSDMKEPYMAAEGFSSVPLLGICRSEVVVTNLTFEGEHVADHYPDPLYMVAIFYFGSGGRVEDCRITGFRGPTLGDGFGRAVQVSNPAFLGTSGVTVQVLRNIFADNNVSVTFIGDSKSWNSARFDPTLLRTTFAVSDNTITGNGPDNAGVQYGIQLLAGAAGEVSRNTITDHAYIGANEPTPWSFGILALDDMNFGSAPLQPLKPIRFEGNVLRNNQWHMLVLRGDGSTFVDNVFDGTAPGKRPTGLALSGENLPVARNHFRNMPNGIVLLGNDPDYGTSLGIAHNAQLTTNRFCNVAKTVAVEPFATVAEQGTLSCPFPPPALAIAPAVLLSWPSQDDGWALESAASVNGPWAAFDATPSTQAGRRTLAVPTDNERRFFRLR